MDTFTRGTLRFDVTELGPGDGAPVLLLHGFPQTAASWEPVARRLAAAGYRVLADAAGADIALMMEGDAAPATSAAPVLTLSREPSRGVYAYDRVALVEAVAAKLGMRS